MKDSKKEKILRSFIIERKTINKEIAEKREYIKNLACLDGFTYASTSKYVIRTKGEIGNFTKHPGYANQDLFNFDNLFEFDPPRINIIENFIKENKCKHCKSGGPKPEICKECGGEGNFIVSSDYNDYWVDCLTCGEGETVPLIIGREYCERCSGLGINAYKYMDFDLPYMLNLVYLRKAMYLPCVKFYIGGEYLGFKNEHFEGIIMGVKRWKHTNVNIQK